MTTKKYSKLPRGFRETPGTGEVVCPHRHLSCCPKCADSDFLVEVYSQHFFASDGRAAAVVRICGKATDASGAVK